jgi:hypothetical protein
MAEIVHAEYGSLLRVLVAIVGSEQSRVRIQEGLERRHNN